MSPRLDTQTADAMVPVRADRVGQVELAGQEALETDLGTATTTGKIGKAEADRAAERKNALERGPAKGGQEVEVQAVVADLVADPVAEAPAEMAGGLEHMGMVTVLVVLVMVLVLMWVEVEAWAPAVVVL